MDLISFDADPSSQPNPSSIEPNFSGTEPRHSSNSRCVQIDPNQVIPSISPRSENEKEENQEEEEEDNRTIDELMDDISDLDSEITKIRFDKNLSKDEILEKINDLMEKRNSLNDKLQNSRNAEFKAFVESLNLQDIHIVPFFPAARRCKLQVNNELSNEILKAPPVETQKKWGLFKKKPSNSDLHASSKVNEDVLNKLLKQHREFTENKRSKLQSDLHQLEKKKYLSPDETATKLRITAELNQLDKFSGAKK
ncbi:hypothetical protein TRFO_03185 [Tritrichomonas foetus]|uniref:Uncharacterized protein n=1 Tax=Tritrichomonas foetus TaxID=1144522 RepID=A0A1J4KS79_9EUKA|nr:hypothetical protein TRFO_03185 [Tritrichomonas foetus]|eukprot:OHT14145.1 hypothetical protein TRFO_03185 [Tritrichomonas foetus]